MVWFDALLFVLKGGERGRGVISITLILDDDIKGMKKRLGHDMSGLWRRVRKVMLNCTESLCT